MIIPTGYAQCNLYFVGSGLPRDAQVAIGVNQDNAFTAAATAAAVGSEFEAAFMPLLSPGITLSYVKAKLGPNDTGPEATVTFGVPGGATGDEPLPPNVAALIKKSTATGGRKGNGRIFLPGVTEDSTTGGGYLVSAALTALQSASDDFLAGLATALCPMVVLHTDATTPTAVTALVVAQLMATQKRRIRRAGGRRAA